MCHRKGICQGVTVINLGEKHGELHFQNPTKLIFGKGMIARLATEIPVGVKIMVTFGGGSVKKNGVYEQVTAALAGRDYIEFWGIEPNPKIETLRKAVAQCKREGVDFLLSVGGGSVLDGTKLIAAAVRYDGDAWDLVRDGSLIGEILPFGDVMTLPATASEMNRNAVISSIETKEKYGMKVDYPRFRYSTRRPLSRCRNTSGRPAWRILSSMSWSSI